MKKLAVLFCLLAAPAMAQQVTAFPAANTPLSGTEQIYLVQNGQGRQTTVGALTGAGSGITFTDGTHVVAGAKQLQFVGGTISGTSPDAVVTISAAASSIAVGTTTVSGGTNNYVLTTGTGTLAQLAPTISGITLGNNLGTLTFGPHLSAGGSSYNGSTGVSITSDATSANTASTIVARDGSGNFSAGTITASLSGHSSLDLAIANNLSDLNSASAARTNLGLGTAAVDNTGTTSGTIPILGSGGLLAASTIPFGTATNQVAEGGVITAAGPTGSATVAPIITYNAAGQLTTVTSATITPAVGSITGLGTGVASALAAATNASGGMIIPSGLSSGTVVSNSYVGLNTSGVPVLGSGGASSGANPTATAGPSAVNGSAATFMRSDGAPAVQKGSSGQFGIIEGDGSTTTISSGVISCTTATVSQIGCVEPDGATITISSGVISAVGGSATSITPGTTTIGGSGSPCVIANTTGTVMGCIGYGTSGASKIIETGSGGFLAAGIIPLATSSTIGGVQPDGTIITVSSGDITVVKATTGAFGVMEVGTGLSVSAGVVTPTFGTATNQVAEGGTITAAGPTGSATVVPIITYNAAGQLTTVSSATIAPAIGSITGLGTGVATALGNAVNASGGVLTSAATLTSAIPISWDSNTTVAAATIPLLNPQWAGGGTITSVTWYATTGSFTAGVQIGGVNVTSCGAINVNSATATTTTCTGANTFTNSSQITLVTSSPASSPNQALVQINMTHSVN